MADLIVTTPGPIGVVARAIRERLEMIFPPKQFNYASMPARLDPNVWKQLLRKFPFVGIGFNGFHKQEVQNDLHVVADFTVYIIVKNEAGIDRLLFGDTYSPGQFALHAAGASILHNVQIPNVGTMHVKEGGFAFIDAEGASDMGVCVINLSVPIDLSLANVLSGLGLAADALTTQSITWSFDGGATTPLTDTIITTGEAT